MRIMLLLSMLLLMQLLLLKLLRFLLQTTQVSPKKKNQINYFTNALHKNSKSLACNCKTARGNEDCAAC